MAPLHLWPANIAGKCQEKSYSSTSSPSAVCSGSVNSIGTITRTDSSLKVYHGSSSLQNCVRFFLSGLNGFLWLVFILLAILPAGPLISSQTLTRQWSTRVVSTKQGLTRGFLFLPRGGHEGVEVFLGLPYASPPLGSLRLMPPVSGAPWTGIKMNENYPPVCPQVFPWGLQTFVAERENGGRSVHGNNNSNNKGNLTHDEEEALKWMPRGRLAQLKRLFPFLTNQSEDCLYLSVYVPLSVADGREEKMLPVLVFIHGEEFGYGAGNAYDPSMLVSQGNIIIVTLNYRLGILGFLNANSDGYFKSPANFALLDQIAALHWVQENIGAFGGDRGNITLMGQGKGAAFVNFLMISNALPKELLFHRVILMSGSALSPLSVGLSNGKDLAKKFAQRVKCPTEPPSNMLQCLRQIPLQYFLQSELWPFFGPSDDGVVIEHGIRENVLRDKLSHYPMLFGVTRAEILPTLGEHDAVYGLETEKRREVLKQLVDGFYSLHRGEILAAAIHEYTDWERPVQHPISVRDETLDALADAQIVSPLMKVGELHSQGNSQTFFYVFEYQSKISDYTQRLGCVPGEDLSYVFGVPLYISWNDYVPPPPPQQLSPTNTITDSHHWNKKVGGSGGTISNGVNMGNYATTMIGGTTEPDPHKLGLFTGNFTRNEVQLSLTLVHYWANFVRSGNPNAEFAEGSTQPGFGGRESNKGSGENIGSGGISAGGNRYPASSSQNQPSSISSSQSSQQQVQFAKPKLVEWPPYDTLFKKYLSIEAKPRVRNHYRAHKLSFWLHLVPELMRNGYYTNNGYPLGSTGGFPSRSNNNNHHSLFSNGNYTTPHSPTIELVGPWEQKPYYYVESNSSYGGDISGPLLYPPGRHPYYHDHRHDGDGYQIYSTALTVTIAVGCSLLILNILVFAAFYYYRDKRRHRHGRRGNTSSSPAPAGSTSSHQDGPYHAHQMNPQTLSGENPSLSTMDLQMQEISVPTSTGNAPSGGGSIMMGHHQGHSQQQPQHPVMGSHQNTPVRFQQQHLKENGQILNLRHHLQPQMPMLPMPNILSEQVPNLQQLLHQQHQQHQQQQHQQQQQQQQQQHHHQSQQQQFMHQVASQQQRKPAPQNAQQKVNLQNIDFSTMPDAILAAAMMLNYRQTPPTSISSSSSGKSATGPSPQSATVPRKSALNMKEQLLISAGMMGQNNASGVASVATLGRSGGHSGSPSMAVAKHPGGAAPAGSVANVIQFDNGVVNSGVKSVPRPPKRHTPTVKFSPDTFASNTGASPPDMSAMSSHQGYGNVVSLAQAPSCSPGGAGANDGTGVPNPTTINQQTAAGSQQTSTLKSSLKKNSSYSAVPTTNNPTASGNAANGTGLSDELKV